MHQKMFHYINTLIFIKTEDRKHINKGNEFMGKMGI